MQSWRLLTTPPMRGAWNMAADEAILRHIGRGDSPPTLRLYAWSPACLSLGYSQPFANVDMQRLAAHSWDVVRRVTGGRAILHTDELTYSIIAPNDEPRMAGSILESYNRLAQALSLALQYLNIPIEIKEERISETPNANPVCFEVSSTYEITANGKKLIGSAQARKKEGALQHGSLPLSGDLTRICETLVFDDEAARAEASQRLLARATTVEAALGRTIAWETASLAFIRAFETQFGIQFEKGELSTSERTAINELVSEKYDCPSWTQRV